MTVYHNSLKAKNNKNKTIFHDVTDKVKKNSRQSPWYNSDWVYRKKITINHKKVLNKKHRDFPILICLLDTELKYIANGGHVAQAKGTDILFTFSCEKTKLYHEIEKYDARTGELRVWVKVLVLSQTTDTILYIYYGNSECCPQQNKESVWDANYKLVLHLSKNCRFYHDSTCNKNNGTQKRRASKDKISEVNIIDNFTEYKNYIKIPHSESLKITDAITVEAWVSSSDYRAEALQTIISKWSPLTTFNTFQAYDAGYTSGLVTEGYFGAVFDGRYVYFVPTIDGNESDGTARPHAKVLRYDTQGDFKNNNSWTAYDARNISGSNTKGFYGGVFNGRYVYFAAGYGIAGGSNGKMLRYDTQKEFTNAKSWYTYNVGGSISYQGAGFDGKYIYFVPGYEKGGKESCKVLRYDTRKVFTQAKSWCIYNAANTSGLNTQCYDGAIFDGRYIYFVPLFHKVVLRYDTQGDFKNSNSWAAYDAGSFKMGSCVGAIFDGRYIYFVPYANSMVVRYDIKGKFTGSESWSAYDASHTSGLNTVGYDGGAFDGRFVYFIPFWDGTTTKSKGFHGIFLRYDTQSNFFNSRSWSAYDASHTSGLNTVGYNGGAFDGRYIYCAPWREGTGHKDEFLPHGRVLRYDTVGEKGAYTLKYSDYGHNGGLSGAVPGPSFIINTNKHVLNVSAHNILEPGRHHIAGVYDGRVIKLFIDGKLAGKKMGGGTIQINNVDISIGRILNGLGYFDGTVDEVQISNIARGDDWITTEYNNQSSCLNFYYIDKEEMKKR